MIVYQETKEQFLLDVYNDKIDEKIERLVYGIGWCGKLLYLRNWKRLKRNILLKKLKEIVKNIINYKLCIYNKVLYKYAVLY